MPALIEMQKTRDHEYYFLADRNILADQAYNSFNAFAEDALVRIRPGKVSTSGSIFFTIFQTFMTGSGDENEDVEEFELKRYEEYPPEFLISSLLMSVIEVEQKMNQTGEVLLL